MLMRRSQNQSWELSAEVPTALSWHFIVASSDSLCLSMGSYNMITQEIKSWAKDFTEVGFKHETELRTLKLIG
jgi:hypothetical protein